MRFYIYFINVVIDFIYISKQLKLTNNLTNEIIEKQLK